MVSSRARFGQRRNLGVSLCRYLPLWIPVRSLLDFIFLTKKADTLYSRPRCGKVTRPLEARGVRGGVPRGVCSYFAHESWRWRGREFAWAAREVELQSLFFLLSAPIQIALTYFRSSAIGSVEIGHVWVGCKRYICISIFLFFLLPLSNPTTVPADYHLLYSTRISVS